MRDSRRPIYIPSLTLLYVFFVVSCVQFILPTQAFASTINLNPSFDAGLSSWVATGDVSVVDGVAVLGDGSDQFGATLYQLIDVGAGQYKLSFDVFSALAVTGDPGLGDYVFPDVAFGTVYYSDVEDVLGNIPSLSNVALFDGDSNGLVAGAGVVGSSVVGLGDGWFRYTTTLDNTARYVVPVFELFDLDFVLNSFIKIDNVTLENVSAQPVPEPLTGTLLLFSAVPLFRLRRRRI